MEEIKQKIHSFAKIPLHISWEENKSTTEINDFLENNPYFHSSDDSLLNCNMLEPVRLIFKENPEKENQETYFVSPPESKESLSNELRNIYEAELKRNLIPKKQNFFSIFKKSEAIQVKKEADALFLSKDYLSALKKYKTINEEFFYHFKEMELYCSILLGEESDLTFLFLKNVVDSQRQFRIIDVLLDLFKIQKKNILRIIQSVSLMKKSKEKYKIVEKMLVYKMKVAVYLYFECFEFLLSENEVEKSEYAFSVVNEIVKNESEFFSEKFKSCFFRIKNDI